MGERRGNALISLCRIFLAHCPVQNRVWRGLERVARSMHSSTFSVPSVGSSPWKTDSSQVTPPTAMPAFLDAEWLAHRITPTGCARHVRFRFCTELIGGPAQDTRRNMRRINAGPVPQQVALRAYPVAGDLPSDPDRTRAAPTIDFSSASTWLIPASSPAAQHRNLAIHRVDYVELAESCLGAGQPNLCAKRSSRSEQRIAVADQ